MSEPTVVCDRDFRHRPHDYTRNGVDHECPGIASRPLPVLVAARPDLAPIGRGPQMLELEVMCA